MAFVSEIEMAANFWLHSGDAHTANNFKAFLSEMLLFLESRKTGLLRLNSGFYSKDIFEYLEEESRKTDYITAVPMYMTVSNSNLCNPANGHFGISMMHKFIGDVKSMLL
jgi:hypothetical protein